MPVPRKILIRVIGAPLLVAALCGILYWGHGFVLAGKPNYPLLGLLGLVGFLSAGEFGEMCRVRGYAVWTSQIKWTIAFLFAAAMVLVPKEVSPTGLFVIIIVLFFLEVACRMVFRFEAFDPAAAGLTFLGLFYVAMLGFLAWPPVPAPLASYYLLFLLAAGKGSDMAAFVAGKSIGRHKMSPVVSPNKTWEGGIAGGIVGTGAGLCVLLFTPLKQVYGAVPVVALLLFCLLVTIAGQVGDLVKSAIKRWAGVKDSGQILPEFGGMIDMVDSFLLEGPVACLGTLVLLNLFKGS